MVKIPDPVVRMIVHPDSNKVLTTVSSCGEPHSIVCGSLIHCGPDSVALGEVMMKTSAKNLKETSIAEVLVWQGKYGYALKSSIVERVTEGPVFDKISERLSMMNMVPTAAWILRIDSIWDASATYSSGDRVV